jgi:uncharacterized protein YecE (DUF72 family)
MPPKTRSTVTPIKDPTLFEMGKKEETGTLVNSLKVERPYSEPGVFLGTSAFTAEGWEGSFYPNGMKPADYLSYYATKFDTVELDNTFYRTPGFIFAAKIPQAITHEKVLVDCEDDLKHFLKTMDALGDKLGLLLFQFGYFNQKAFETQADFVARLKPFLKTLPKGYRFAVEIRNKNWMNAEFRDVLRERGVAFTLIDQGWVPRPWELKEKFDLVTADFTYVRWLGDRKAIEEETKTWDKTIVNRRGDLKRWVDVLKELVLNKRIRQIFAFAKNHYAGHGPATVKQFLDL